MAMHAALLGITGANAPSKTIIPILRASGDSDALSTARGAGCCAGRARPRAAPGTALSQRDTVSEASGQHGGAAASEPHEISTKQQSDLRAEYICRSGSGVIMQMF